MRKLLFFLVILLSSVATSANKLSSYSGLYLPVSHWSVDVIGGVNLFDGDIPQNNSILPSSSLSTALGVNVNYQFTPTYSLFVDYNYYSIKAQTKGWDIRTKIHMAAINTSVNFGSLLFPSDYFSSRFNVYGSIGVGLAKYFYNTGYTTPLDHGTAVTLPVSLYCIYNVSEHIGVGLKFSYVSFNTDNLEGITYLNYKGVSNDCIESGTFFLRYNL
jgi:hypothetical protein